MNSLKKMESKNNHSKEQNYWLEKLSGDLTYSYLPYDFNESSERLIINTRSFEIKGEDYNQLMKMCNGSDPMLYIILIAEINILLNKYTGNNDLIIGSPVEKQLNKNDIINTQIALRNTINDNLTFKEFLLQVRKTVVDALENQNCSYDALLSNLNKKSLFDIAVVFENIQDKDYLDADEYNILFSFKREDNRIILNIEYNSSLYMDHTIDYLISHFINILHSTIFKPDILLNEIDLLSLEEKLKLLKNFNSTKTEYENNKSIVDLFTNTADKFPDKVALSYNDTLITYKELNKETNQLASFLRKKDIENNSIVAIMMSNSIELIVSILGVLKAGDAYLPIDINTPTNRVITMLDDSKVSLVLTDNGAMSLHSFLEVQGFKDKVYPIITENRSNIKNFDNLPLPDRSLVDYEKYNKFGGIATIKNSITIQATRGCPYKCAYCHKIWPKTHIIRSAENIYSEVKLYYDMGVRRFTFIDDIFNLNIKNSTHFFQLVIDNELDVQLFFPNGVRGDILTYEYIDLMIKAGTVHISFALETGSTRIQKLIKKNLNLESFYKNITYISDNYPHVILDLYSMHGFPSETKEEAMMTLDFIKKIKWLHFPFVFILKIFPNTDMYELAINNGIKPQDIFRSTNKAYHELPETLPFDKSFTLKYQNDFFNNYFLNKERLLKVLPYQMKIYSEDELLMRYNSYLPVWIDNLSDLLKFLGIDKNEIEDTNCTDENSKYVPKLNNKISAKFKKDNLPKGPIRILLIDLSQSFLGDGAIFEELLEPPLGLIYLSTYLNKHYNADMCKIIKSRVDFNNYNELKLTIDEYNPHLIGVRGLTMTKDFLHSTINEIKLHNKNIPIIIGGPYSTSDYNYALQDKNIDIAVIGEGELTFTELVEKFIENSNKLPEDVVLKGINGIAYIQNSEKLQISSQRDVIIYSDIKDIIKLEPEDDLKLEVKPNDLAYVIYTSGTTGSPKGTLLEHKGIVSQNEFWKSTFKVRYNDNVMLFASLSFDASVSEVFMALLNGATLNVPDDNSKMSLVTFEQYMLKNNITVITLPPVFASSISQNSVKYLKVLITAGSQTSDKLIQKFTGNRDYINAYGPTEASICATSWDTKNLVHSKTVLIGKPINNVKVYIIDKRMQLQGIGIFGELCISGIGLARGYVDMPEFTNDKFVPNPFEENTLMYKTGDYARWLPSGDIEFLGRFDDQVKIRGYRVELKEIEKTLLKHNSVESSIVVKKNIYNEEQLIAYYKRNNKIGLWPSLAEYYVYDDRIYKHFANDELRNEKYRKAISKVVKDKVVLEIGPGSECILSLICLQEGAKRIYAIEIIEDAYQKALQKIKSLGLEDKIILLHGDATKIDLPEKVDCCVSEIVGSIGGAEGAAKIINDIQVKMKDEFSMIPSKSISKVAAVTLPKQDFDASFDEVAAYYVEKIFENIGKKFDLRLVLSSFKKKNIISDIGIFEDLDFNKNIELEAEHNITLRFNEDSTFNGLIVWLVLHCDEEEIIDAIEEKYIWLPVYFPVFYKGIKVKKGNYLNAKITRKLAKNGLNPDYYITGELHLDDDKTEKFEYVSMNIPDVFKDTPFYEEIFPDDKIKISELKEEDDFKEFLSKKLPEYMIPSFYVEMDEMPLNTSGKIDYSSLPDPEIKSESDFKLPGNEIEERIVKIWEDVLNIPSNLISTNSSFFDLGGHSLKAILLQSKISKEFGVSIPLSEIFEKHTVKDIAVMLFNLEEIEDEAQVIEI